MVDKTNLAFKGKYLRLINSQGWEYVERSNCSGIVVIIAVTEDRKLLLVEQFRIPVQKSVIEFPAGLVGDLHENPNELLETAAKRELLEETGYKADHMDFILEGPPSAGLSSEIITFFYATGLQKITAGGGDHTESIKVYEIPLQEVSMFLCKKRKKGVLVDPKIYSGLYFLEKKDFF
ncbi:MAG: NUDIX hydrolase [Spirochaetales bacterium]|nr:NUDIX hydrolase [Spirochaetales bacterium]